MAFPMDSNGYRDGQHLLKPSLTLTSEDLIVSTGSSVTTTPYDDSWLVSNTVSPFLIQKSITQSKDIAIWKRRLPYFTILITLSEIFTHLLVEIQKNNLYNPPLYNLFVFDPCKSFEIWRYFTYMLIHSDVHHLAMNISMQFVVGIPLEWYQGSKKTSVIYISGIIFGTLGAFVFQSGTKVIGASAGTYALLWSHFADCFMNRNRKYILIQVLTVLLIILIDVGYIWYHLSKEGNTCPKVGWSAHYAGALNGFFLGFTLFEGNFKKTTCMHVLNITCWIIWVILLSTVLLLNIFQIHI